MIELNYIPELPEIPYRNGEGQWEGVVMHATAVFGDTALGERQYECSHHAKAFVHSFSDPHSTLEVANPNFIAFGAGSIANQRYLHLELCQVKNDGSQKSKDDFKASYGNWIEYAAQRLYDRKLGVIAATPDGKGTVWQHYDVTKYLGGSTHVDPMDYLSTWSVTWEQVISDIQNKYTELETMDDILKQLADLQGQVKTLEDAAAKVAAPTWFVDEFKSADLGGLIKEPCKSNEFWETVAVVLRAVKFVPSI